MSERNARIEELASTAIACGLAIHRALGPGLLESAYEAVLAHELEQHGLSVRRQTPVPLRYNGVVIGEGFRADILIDELLLVELKSVERSSPLHAKQVYTYLKLLDLPLGLLMNFGAETFRDGLKRVIHNYDGLGRRGNFSHEGTTAR